MSTGTVKRLNGQKGFGFIQVDGGGKDVFVHITALERAGMQSLNEGQKISFDVVPDRRTGKVLCREPAHSVTGGALIRADLGCNSKAGGSRPTFV